MRYLLLAAILLCLNSYGQLKDYKIGVKGDTLNKIDNQDKKQGKWILRYDELRGEPGFEEEGIFITDKKEGSWRKYSLNGDLLALENYKWGNKDSINLYYNTVGQLIREESWRAINPDKKYDTVEVEDVINLDHYKTVIIKNDGTAIKHGLWKTYDGQTGRVVKTEMYVLGNLEKPTTDEPAATTTGAKKPKAKPAEVLEYEKKNAGKKKIKVRDGATQ